MESNGSYYDQNGVDFDIFIIIVEFLRMNKNIPRRFQIIGDNFVKYVMGRTTNAKNNDVWLSKYSAIFNFNRSFWIYEITQYMKVYLDNPMPSIN